MNVNIGHRYNIAKWADELLEIIVSKKHLVKVYE